MGNGSNNIYMRVYAEIYRWELDFFPFGDLISRVTFDRWQSIHDLSQLPQSCLTDNQMNHFDLNFTFTPEWNKLSKW